MNVFERSIHLGNMIPSRPAHPVNSQGNISFCEIMNRILLIEHFHAISWMIICESKNITKEKALKHNAWQKSEILAHLTNGQGETKLWRRLHCAFVLHYSYARYM